MGYAISIAEKANRGLTIPMLLSGDTHHYSRYVAQDGTQFITSGGGGAFRHPTHHIAREATLVWFDRKKNISLATIPNPAKPEAASAAVYPSMEVSRKLLWRNLWFALKNWDFSLLMGVVYWFMGIGLTLRDQWDGYIIVTIIFAAVLMGYATKQEKSARPVVLISSALHATAQALAVILFARLFMHWNDTHFVIAGKWYSIWKWLGILLIEMGFVGFLIGSSLFGLNMLITCMFFRMNYNDAFSAFRLNRYNNFLRLRIKGDDLEVYAIGLDDVPDREQWIKNPKAGPGISDEPVFVSEPPLRPHLIERFKLA